jgi:hypothetical protein
MSYTYPYSSFFVNIYRFVITYIICLDDAFHAMTMTIGENECLNWDNRL